MIWSDASCKRLGSKSFKERAIGATVMTVVILYRSTADGSLSTQGSVKHRLMFWCPPKRKWPVIWHNFPLDIENVLHNNVKEQTKKKKKEVNSSPLGSRGWEFVRIFLCFYVWIWRGYELWIREELYPRSHFSRFLVFSLLWWGLGKICHINNTKSQHDSWMSCMLSASVANGGST